ncbi:DNA polymerase III subunit delta' [Sphingomicrobium arenosum]|uniref:DNA polymerase III subunit delta' n=1 Tax=Sphingomicrobium arenosum TaxID=2233861 RepID=UPI00223FA88D|nr:DNA polymerase III subunit delta' [Sphingomicrobium arenosum]
MIIGQDEAVGRFVAAWSSRTPHHAWLLAGPKGVGKARFAEAAALRVLAEAAGPVPEGAGLEVSPEHRIAHLFEAGSHPDYRRLERGMNKAGTGLARNISVAQVRELSHLFAVTPSLSDWRVIVIDSADDLEVSAANALLKMLEEPPVKTLFFLVTHAPGRLLPTIRSRCRRLDFAPLSEGDVARVLETALPKADGQERARLASLSGGSAGRAVAIAEHDLTPLAETARLLMRDGDPTNGKRAALAKSLSLKAAADRYAIFLSMLPGLVAQEARGAEGARRAALLAAYAEARRTAQLAPRLSSDPASTIYVLTGHLAAAARHG